MENMIKRFFSGILTAALAACMIQLPAAAEDSAGYYWLEAEEAACSAEYQLVENKEASGGKLMGVYETKNGEYSVEFQFENEKPGAYDIWFLSGKGTLRKISKFKWSVNDSAPAEFPSGNPVSENAVYSEYFNENDCDIYWNKIAARTTLSEGSNSVKFIVSAKTALNTELGEKAFGAACARAEVWLTLRAEHNADLDALRTAVLGCAKALAEEAALDFSFEEQDVFPATEKVVSACVKIKADIHMS